MRRLRPSSEAEMVALFLRTELSSDRWRDDLRALLKRAGPNCNPNCNPASLDASGPLPGVPGRGP